MRTVTRTLLCTLTAEEHNRVYAAHCAKLKEIELVQNEKRAAVSTHNATLKELRAEERRLFAAADVGAEEREVECREEDAGDGTIRVFRTDTGEWLEDPRQGAERQQELPLTRPGRACEGCGNADGTHHPSCFVGQVNGGIVDPSDGDDDGDAPDYSEAAEIAAEQVATGSAPELGEPAKKSRKRKGAEASA
jgi:hypothetical protein